MEVKPGLWDPQKCPFPLNRGVLSIEVTVTKIMWTFFRHQIFVSLEWRCPLNRGVPMERFHCSRDKQNRKSERKRKKILQGLGEKGLLSPVHIWVPRLFLLPRAIPRACFSHRSFRQEQTTGCSRSRCTIGSWGMSSCCGKGVSTVCKR